jgi:hypothetical protein
MSPAALSTVMAGVFVVMLPPGAAAQQQGAVQISSDSQIVAGNAARQVGEQGFQPDVAIVWSQPATSFGDVRLETHTTRRGDTVRVGRTSLAVQGVKAAGLTWSLEGGDLYSRPDPGDYQFSNLTAPVLTFTGGFVTARSAKATVQIGGGRSNALRNIFGSDAEMLGQSVAIARATFQPDARWIVNARAARTRTSNLGEFTATVDASQQAGGGARFIASPVLQLVADASFVKYRATGATTDSRDYSYVAGTHVLLPRGSVEVNATRYSPGDLPVLNAILHDRSGIFASADYDLAAWARAFGGWETVTTNIHPTGTALLRPEASANRGFAGIRVRVPGRSTLSFRFEDGGRVAKPVTGYPVVNGVLATESDTGAYSADWQMSRGRLTALARASKRDNIDVTNGIGTFSQRDAAGQVFFNVSHQRQIFGGVTIGIQNARTADNTYLEVSGGLQQQLREQSLWMRIEATASRNHERFTGLLFPRNALNAGLNGQLTRYTSIGVNVYVDRAPVGITPGQSGWLTRAMVRFVHTIPTGETRLAAARIAVDGSRSSRGSGSIVGSVFADWNGNGLPDPGEDPIAGIPIRLNASVGTSTAKDGQFAFQNVPVGAQNVGLDLHAVPVDYDLPDAPDVTVDVARGEARRVALALIPLGTIAGRVVEDVNQNGAVDPEDPVVNDVVVTLDSGARSEMARNGTFAFTAVRAGAHTVQLLKESLPVGANAVGRTVLTTSIERDHLKVDVVFLVRVEKRPEIRKVFRGTRGLP